MPRGRGRGGGGGHYAQRVTSSSQDIDSQLFSLALNSVASHNSQTMYVPNPFGVHQPGSGGRMGGYQGRGGAGRGGEGGGDATVSRNPVHQSSSGGWVPGGGYRGHRGRGLGGHGAGRGGEGGDSTVTHNTAGEEQPSSGGGWVPGGGYRGHRGRGIGGYGAGGGGRGGGGYYGGAGGGSGSALDGHQSVSSDVRRCPYQYARGGGGVWGSNPPHRSQYQQHYDGYQRPSPIQYPQPYQLDPINQSQAWHQQHGYAGWAGGSSAPHPAATGSTYVSYGTAPYTSNAVLVVPSNVSLHVLNPEEAAALYHQHYGSTTTPNDDWLHSDTQRVARWPGHVPTTTAPAAVDWATGLLPPEVAVTHSVDADEERARAARLAAMLTRLARSAQLQRDGAVNDEDWDSDADEYTLDDYEDNEERQRELEEEEETEAAREDRLKQEHEEDNLPESLSLAYSRACGVCLAPNPRRRANLVACGHLLCMPCAEQLEKVHRTIVRCPFCREYTRYVRIFEELEAVAGGEGPAAPAADPAVADAVAADMKEAACAAESEVQLVVGVEAAVEVEPPWQVVKRR